jgi:hypothetical protein
LEMSKLTVDDDDANSSDFFVVSLKFISSSLVSDGDLNSNGFLHISFDLEKKKEQLFLRFYCFIKKKPRKIFEATKKRSRGYSGIWSSF